MQERNQIDNQFKWKLEDMFATTDAWEETFKKVQSYPEALTALKGTITSAQGLLDVLLLDEEASIEFERLFCYARMRRDEDNRDSAAQGMVDRATALAVAVSSATSYVTPEILAQDDATLTAWCAHPGMERFAHSIENVMRSRAHVLSAAEERVLAMGGELAQAPRSIFSMLDYADMTFPQMMVDGEEIQLTTGVYTHIREHQNRGVRKEAFEKFFGTYQGFKNTYAATLASSVKKDLYYATVRNHKSTIESDLFGDNVPVSVYDNLIASVRKNLPVLRRYLELKKRALKLGDLQMYDLYVPLIDLDYKTTYEEAQRMVVESCAPLGEEYGSILQSAFKDGWVDVYENTGKTSGAYSWGAYGTHPFVLMNYKDDIGSAFTLAHEMGHAMHSYLSDRANDYTNAQYPIFLAEVASTVNESLLLNYLLERADDRQKTYLLLEHCEQFRTTVFRQVMFAEFERELHKMAQQGEPLTAESISALYASLNGTYNAGVEQNELIALEWAYVSHFYNAFYVYQYATGFSSALYLSEQVRAGNRAGYLELLGSGGKDYPMNLLKKAGVDLATPAPVDAALAVFARSIDKLEALIG